MNVNAGDIVHNVETLLEKAGTNRYRADDFLGGARNLLRLAKSAEKEAPDDEPLKRAISQLERWLEERIGPTT